MDRFTSDNYIGKSGICASHKRLEGCSETHSHEFFELEYISGGIGSYTLDGEVVGCTDFTIDICPAAVRFVVPAEKAAASNEEQAAEPATV